MSSCKDVPRICELPRMVLDNATKLDKQQTSITIEIVLVYNGIGI